MSIVVKYRGMRKHIRSITVVFSFALATGACAAPRASNTPIAGGAGGGVKPLVRIPPIYPLEAEVREDRGVCVSTRLTLTKSGRVARLKVVGAYPTIRHVQWYGYVEAVRQAMNKWRFAARSKSADFSSTPKLLQKVVFIGVPPGTASSTLALGLACRQPYILAPKPISILLGPASPPDSSALAAASGRKNGVGAAGISVSIPTAMRITKSWQGAENIRARFCVDPQKRIANVVLKGGTPEGRAVALAALGELPVAAAKFRRSASRPQQLSTIVVTGWRMGDAGRVRRMEQIQNKVIKAGVPIWACGLRVEVRLFAKPKGPTIGLIKRTSFGRLSGESDMPPVIASHSPRQKLAVPATAELPDKARIDVEFCITPEGSPVAVHVVSAKPAKIFNQVALKVVAGWRFARRRHKMCDVYQQVGFKIPHRAGSA